MFYIIYKITNQINGKIYIGSHKTKDLNDAYMGSGKYLKRAQEKHGIENFTREILFVFDNPEQMYAKEKEIVNEDFLSEENTYNLKIGGFGGWDYINQNSDKFLSRLDSLMPIEETQKLWMLKYESDSEFREQVRLNALAATRASMEKNPHGPFHGKRHSEEFKKRMSSMMREKSVGENNSQFGSMWITDGLVSKKIMKTDAIPDGWKIGRIIVKR